MARKPRRRPVPPPSATVGDMETPTPTPPRNPLPVAFWITVCFALCLLTVSLWAYTLGPDNAVKLLAGISDLAKAAASK